IPSLIIVRREISKVRHQYFTFINQKGCEYLLAYLRERVQSGEKLGPDSPVIKSDSRKKQAALLAYPKELRYFVCTQNITEEIKRAIRGAGFNWRPYILRSYFASHLLTAELDGKMSTDIRAFFEGHVGDIERVYTTGKHNLSKELMSKVRNQYVQGSPYLDGSLAQLEKIEQIRNEARNDIRLQTAEFLADSLYGEHDSIYSWYSQESHILKLTSEQKVLAIQARIRHTRGIEPYP
ncbi:MAG: hypothetical protein ACREAN_03890, partial [Nitrosopumilaceae archaeon]